MSRQAGNWLVVGSSGSGKSHYLNDLLTAYTGRYRYLVVVNASNELSEHCAHSEYVGLEKLSRAYSPEGLAALIRTHGSVFFELAPTGAEAFLDTLGEAVMSLGEYDTDECQVLLVLDEARHWVTKGAMPAGLERCEAEGRKYGIDIIKATQRLGSSSQDTIDLAAVAQVTRVVIFPLAELNQRRRLMEMFPDLPDSATLKRPVPEKGWGGEYLVWDVLAGRGACVRRGPDGSRHLEDVDNETIHA